MQHLQKTRGEPFWTSPIPAFNLSTCQHALHEPPTFCIVFQVPYPATPLFATLTKTPGMCTNNSHSGAPLHQRCPLLPIPKPPPAISSPGPLADFSPRS